MPPITPDSTDIPDEGSETATTCSTTVESNIFPHSDSDSESESVDHDGYELLSQDPEFFFSAENEDEDAISDVEEQVTAEVNYLPSSQPFSDSGCQHSPEVKIMSEDHIETIKSVMKGITLPSSNLPQWATLVPEEEWKAALLSQMHTRNLKIPFSDNEVHPELSIIKDINDASNEALR